MAETRIGIVTNTAKPGAKELLPRLVDGFAARGVSTRLEKEGADLIGDPAGVDLAELAEEVELIVVLGGDGTILHVVHRLRDRLKPLAGLNIGSLGFLTCATSANLDDFIRVIAGREFVSSPRSVLEVEVDNGETRTYYGLNEAAVSRSDSSGIVSLEARINGEFISNYSGDGLIIGTPTGSTAYSFSAGGAIVEPASEVFLLTPICPHALANRSMVVSNRERIEVRLMNDRKDAVLAVDGQFIQPVGPHTKIRIRRAPFDLSLIMMPGQTFYQILQQKLQWRGSNV